MVNNKQEQKRQKRVIYKPDKKTRENIKSKKNSNKNKASKGFYYSFLTIILILCLIQIAVSAVLNVSKVVSYKSKISQIKKSRDAALAMNEQLKENINNFSNVSGLEAIARNNLKMASEDEVLVIINAKEEKEQKTRKIGFIKHD